MYYPKETLGEDADDGTMPSNVAHLGSAVVGRRIVDAVQVKTGQYSVAKTLLLTLDDGTSVEMADTADCCAVTELKEFFLDPDSVDHVITGVGTTNKYNTWHIYADLKDILKLDLEWSPGNPFDYGYGFSITVTAGRK